LIAFPPNSILKKGIQCKDTQLSYGLEWNSYDFYKKPIAISKKSIDILREPYEFGEMSIDFLLASYEFREMSIDFFKKSYDLKNGNSSFYFILKKLFNSL